MMPAMSVPDLPIKDFLDSLGRKTPSPGGGATAALAGALGAAQLLMAVEFSTWDGGSDPRATLKEVVRALPDLAQRDTDAYARFAAARKTRKEDPAAFAGATKAILEVPLEIMDHCLAALACLPETIRRAPGWFACDLGIAYDCLRAGVEGARSLAGANLAPVPAAQRDRAILGRLAASERRYDDLRRTIDPLLAARQAGA
jgi:formiminotetrahydrofolate cyclodeaminase